MQSLKVETDSKNKLIKQTEIMNYDNPLNNLDIIKLEVVKIYDKRNKELSNYNLVILDGKEQLITKERYDEIYEHNRILKNEDLKFMKYLSKWES